MEGRAVSGLDKKRPTCQRQMTKNDVRSEWRLDKPRSRKKSRKKGSAEKREAEKRSRKKGSGFTFYHRAEQMR